MAREREAQNAALYRQAGNAVYHSRRFEIPSSTPYDYPQRPAVQLGSATFDIFAQRYDRPNAIQAPPAQQDMLARPPRRYDLPDDRGLLDLNMPPTQLSRPPTSWSSENYTDFHSRYPTFAKDLVTQPAQRDGTLSPRDVDWAEDHYDYGHGGNFGQGPNGTNKGAYSIRKDI
jgi:hypothetical protein